MRGLLLVLSVLAGVGSDCIAQWDPRSIARSNLDGVASREVWIGHGSPASLAGSNVPRVDIAFVPAPFDLKELRRIGALVVIPFSGWTISGQLTSYGVDLFRRYDLGASVGTFLDERTAAGLRISVERWTFRSYGGLAAWSLTAGTARHEDDWSVGMRMRWEGVGGSGRESVINVCGGFTIRPVPAVDISWEVEQEAGNSRIVRYGMTYFPIDEMGILGGWSDTVPLLGCGTVFVLPGIRVAFGSQYHRELGWSHSTSFSLHLGEESR